LRVDEMSSHIEYYEEMRRARPYYRGKPTIAVDCDEVLAQFVPALCEFHNATYGTPALSARTFHSYKFCEVWGGTNEESMEKVFAFFKSPYFLDNLKPIDGALNVLSSFRDSFDFVIVTSRQHSIQDQTLKWLRANFPPGIFKDVLFGNHWTRDAPGPEIATSNKRSKQEMCRAANAVLLIDDSVKYARQCSTVLDGVVLFGNYAWNQLSEDESGLPENVTRANSWSEVARVLSDMRTRLARSQTEAQPLRGW